jgi:aspartate ammonia-lyase
MSDVAMRYEHDLLGDRPVPASAYYGVHTLRAVENFPITGTPISIYPDLINALACVKQAAALANNELGLLTRTGPMSSSGPAKKSARANCTRSLSSM